MWNTSCLFCDIEKSLQTNVNRKIVKEFEPSLICVCHNTAGYIALQSLKYIPNNVYAFIIT